MPSDTFEKVRDGKRFKVHLKERLFTTNAELAKFCNSLQKHKVLIAGGSVLAVHTTPQFESGDIDMYVDKYYAESFIKDLLKLDDISFYSWFTRSVYDKSFLRRNNILYSLSGVIKTVGKKMTRFDIMVTQTDPTKVVGNFDLSCCQIYFDGLDVYATHFNEINEKKCHLRTEYHEAWYAGNFFLKNRVRKYAQRGFTITMEMNNVKQKLTISDKNKKLIPNYDEYIAVKIINYILNDIVRLSWQWVNLKRSESGLKKIAQDKEIILEFLSLSFSLVDLDGVEIYEIETMYNKFKKQTFIDLYIQVFSDFFFDNNVTYIKTSDHNKAINKTFRTKYQICIEALFLYLLMQENIDLSKLNEMKTAYVEAEALYVEEKAAYDAEKIIYDAEKAAYDAEKKRLEEERNHEELKKLKPVKELEKLGPSPIPLLLEECNMDSVQTLLIQNTKKRISSSTKIFDFEQYDYKQFDKDADVTDIIVFQNNRFIFSFTRERFMSIVTDKNNWFFECTRVTPIGHRIEENRAMIYIKFPINKEGANGFFRINDIYALLSTTSSNCFEIIQPDSMCPVRTVSFPNMNLNNDHISTNYCQHGSNILLFRFKALASFRAPTDPPAAPPPTTEANPGQGGGGCKQPIYNKTYKFVYKKEVGGRLRNVYRCSRKLFVKRQGKFVSINDYNKKGLKK